MKTIDELVADADQLMMTKAAAARAGTAAKPQASSDVQKLAAQILNPPARPAGVEKVAAPGHGLTFDMVLSLARAETMINLPTFRKMAAVADKAREAGHSEEKIAQFFEKNASAFPLKSVFQLMPWLFEAG
jgi:hypothetical protein